MRVFHDLSDLPSFRHAVVTTGSFDGVHQGHQKILRQIEELTEKYQGESVVITFDPHPRQVIYPKDNTLRLLTSTREKLKYLEENGVDNVVVLPFTIEFSQQLAREYVENFLIKTFAPKCLVVGYDHRFGLNREGTYDLLKEYEEQGHFDLVQIVKQDVEQITVSSTKIRKAVAEGDIALANRFLGRPYRIQGTVVHGQKLGTELGYPTANVKPELDIKLIPADGVYAVMVGLEDTQYPGMLYIGKKPTVSPENAETNIEVNLFDFDGDLYDGSIAVDLIAFIRGDKKLDTLGELREAIREDERTIREHLKSHIGNKASTADVAIVALNWNGADLLHKYLPSFVSHGCGAQVILADNGSTDNSVDIVRKDFPSIEVMELESNTGYAGGYNNALMGMDYKYLALVNTDIELTSGWLDPLVEALEADPTIAAVQPKVLDSKDKTKFEYAGGAGGYMDSLGYPFCSGRILSEIEEDNGQYDEIREIFWASGAAFVIRTEVFQKMGGFDPDYFAHMEEIDLCWRIRSAGCKIMSIPQSVVYHEGGGTLPYKSARKVYLNFRNNIATLIKNCQTRTLLYLLPARLLLDVLAALHFIAKMEFQSAWAVVRAYGRLILWLPSLLSKRTQNKRRIASISLGKRRRTGIYSGSIIWQFYAKGKRKFSDLKMP